MSTENWTKSAR